LYIYHTGSNGLGKMTATGEEVAGYKRYVASSSRTYGGTGSEYLTIYL